MKSVKSKIDKTAHKKYNKIHEEEFMEDSVFSNNDTDNNMGQDSRLDNNQNRRELVNSSFSLWEMFFVQKKRQFIRKLSLINKVFYYLKNRLLILHLFVQKCYIFVNHQE